MVVPGPRVHHESRRLVDHGDQRVGIDDPEEHARLRRHLRSARFRQEHGDRRSLTQSDPPGRHGHAVDEHAAGLDQLGRHTP